MKLLYSIRSLFGIFIFSSLPLLGQAQDLIARQAPVDRRVKAADSVSLKYLLNAERIEEINGLYPDFNNSSVHNYKGAVVPDSFRIDMRHFCMPTPSRQVTSGYGYRPAFRRVHKGLDIKVYIGDTIKAAFSGKVRIVDYERGGYGNYVVIRHNNGLETVYGPCFLTLKTKILFPIIMCFTTMRNQEAKTLLPNLTGTKVKSRMLQMLLLT